MGVQQKRGSLKLRIPNRHEGEMSSDLLKRLLRQAGITGEEGEKA